MDAGRLSICGEESLELVPIIFERKMDLWAVLAWLSILAHRNKDVPSVVRKFQLNRLPENIGQSTAGISSAAMTTKAASHNRAKR